MGDPTGGYPEFDCGRNTTAVRYVRQVQALEAGTLDPRSLILSRCRLRVSGGGADSVVDGPSPCRTMLKVTVGLYFEAARLRQDPFSAENGNVGQ